MTSINRGYIVGLFVFSLLTACVDRDSEPPSNTSSGTASVHDASLKSVQLAREEIQIVGAGIKGPLAFADAMVYQLDPSFPEFYDKSTPIASVMTNESAQIVGLWINPDISPPYILSVGGEHAIDLNTGKTPIISPLITVITEDMLASEHPFYSTTLTTMAFHMARYGASASTDVSNFMQHLRNASNMVNRLFAIDENIEIDVFTSPIIINDNTPTLSEQIVAVHHRAANEAFSAKVHMLSSSSVEDIDADSIIHRLARDLYSDGVIDNTENGAPIGGINPTIVSENPLKLMIPNTQYLVEDVITIMEYERVLLGTATGPNFYTESITLPRVITPSAPTTSVTPTESPDSTVNQGETVSSEATSEVDYEPILTVSTDSIDFGNHDIGTTSDPSRLTLTNNGTAPMTISETVFPSNFVRSTNCDNYLPVGGNCSISITFVPTEAGFTAGEITINGNAENTPYTVQLTGTGNTVTAMSTGRYLSEDFESENWSDRYKVLNNVTRESGVAARSGSYGLRIEALKGEHWGGRILFDHKRHGQRGNFKEIWTRYYIRFGPNWTRNDWRMGKAGYRARSDETCKAPCLEMTDSHKLTDSGSIAGISYFHRNVSEADVQAKTFSFKHRDWSGGERVRNQWYCVETHHVLNMPGKKNGIYQNWVDGALVSDQRDVNQRDSATFDIDNSVLIAYIGGGWVADHDMSVYFDDWVVSDKRIGCQ